jgi:peptidoglycan/LPS O-acetylase OafA/YrhL
MFPLIVAIGAGGSLKGTQEGKVNKFLGELSYPLYITHYPLIYLFTAWVTTNHVPLAKGLPVGALLLVTSIAIAYASLKLYDEPVRARLTKRFLLKQK